MLLRTLQNNRWSLFYEITMKKYRTVVSIIYYYHYADRSWIISDKNSDWQVVDYL